MKIFDFHRCDKKIVIIDFNRLNWLINRQILSIIEYYRLIDYIFNDRFRSIRYALPIVAGYSEVAPPFSELLLSQCSFATFSNRTRSLDIYRFPTMKKYKQAMFFSFGLFWSYFWESILQEYPVYIAHYIISGGYLLTTYLTVQVH